MLDVDALLKDYFQQPDGSNNKPLMKAASSVLKSFSIRKKSMLLLRLTNIWKDWNSMMLF